MTVTIDPTPAPITPDTPVFPEAPAGFEPVSLYAYDRLFYYTTDTDFDTLAFNFYSPVEITRDQIGAAMDQLLAQLDPLRYDLLAYGVWGQKVFDLQVPSQFCVFDYEHCVQVPNEICVPFTNWCIPVAGQTFAAAYDYHLWLIVKEKVAIGPMAVRPFLPLATALGIVLIIIALLTMIVAVHQIVTGKITFSQFISGVKTVLTTPGQNVKEPIGELSWPIVAFGITLVAMSIAFPYIVTKAQVTLPVGRGTIGGEVQLGGAPPPPPPPAPTGGRRVIVT